MVKKYPQWIEEYTYAYHNGFAHVVPCSLGPIDAYAVLGFLNGEFLAKLHKAIVVMKKKNLPITEIVKSFPSPSGFRMAIYFAMVEYQYSNDKNKIQFRETLDFLLEVLRRIAKEDMFVYESNIVHTSKEIKGILDNTPWVNGEPVVARELGKLYSSLAALVFALYCDYFPQESHEIYGPYDVSEKFGKSTTLVVKHFPKIRPVELWPDIAELKHVEVKLFQVYKDVSFKCELMGMHSIYGGSLINNLVAYAISIDGIFVSDPQEIKRLSEYFAEIATKQSMVYEGMSKEELKKKVLEWLCYQFVYFFPLADMDWKPTQMMLDAVKDKEVAERFVLTQAPTYEEYSTSPDFEVYWLKDLYLST